MSMTSEAFREMRDWVRDIHKDAQATSGALDRLSRMVDKFFADSQGSLEAIQEPRIPSAARLAIEEFKGHNRVILYRNDKALLCWSPPGTIVKAIDRGETITLLLRGASNE